MQAEPVPAAPAATPTAVAVKELSFGRFPGWVVPAVLGVMLYFALFLPSGRMSMILTFVVLALVVVFLKSAVANLKDRLSIPVLGLFAFMLMVGLSAIYGTYGDLASQEFVKYLAAFPVALTALLWVEQHHLRKIFWILSGLLAFLALICVDTSATGMIYGLFVTVMDGLGATFGDVNQYVGAGRINGLYNNANVTSSMFAVGGLLSIWLARTGEKKWEKPLAAFFMGLQAMGFFLSMSRGAILCFGVTLIAYVVFTAKEERLSLVFFLIETVVVTILLSAVAMGFLGTDGSFVPVLLTLICGPVVYALDRFVGAPVAMKLAGKGKAIALACGALVALAVVYVVAALNITGAHSFISGQRLYRTEELSAGNYTLTAEYDGEITLDVIAIDTTKPLDEQNTTLFSDEPDAVAFTVPEGTIYVEFIFYGETGDELHTARLSDGTELALSYPLLPAFLANRMEEGLLSGSSFTMRIQYVKDGLKLFLNRPLLGYGQGGTEGWLVSVQPYRYETKYLHNHVVQIMADMGVLGLAPFLTLMLGAAWLLIRNLRKEQGSLAAVLLACWLMMNLHGLMELSFSIRGYQVMAYTLLALILVAFPKPIRDHKAFMKRAGTFGMAFATLWLAFFGITYEMSRMAKKQAEEFVFISNEQVMSDIEKMIKMDLYQPEDQKISYVANAMVLQSPFYNGKMHQYAEDLRSQGTYLNCASLCEHYYLPMQDFEELFECSREGLRSLAMYRDAWNMQYVFYFEQVLPYVGPENFETFINGVNATRALQAEIEAERMEPIDMAVLTQTYLESMDAALAGSETIEEAYGQLLLIVQQNMEAAQ